MSKVLDYNGLEHYDEKIKVVISKKSEVSVSSTGTATDEVGYITINGVEKKIAGGGVPDNMVTTDTAQTITGNKTMSSIKMRTQTSDIQNYLGQTMLIGNGINTFIGNRDHPNGTTIIRGVNRPKWQNSSTTIDIATTDQIPTVEANPENPTQTLSSIKIGDIDYSVGGGGEPDAYIKSASVTDNTLTLVNKDNTTVEFTPQGGGTVAIDNKTIIKNTDDELETAIGGKYVSQQVAGNKVCDVDSYFSDSGTETHITYTILQKLLQLDEQNLLKFLYISSGTTYIVPVTIDRSTSGTYVIDVIKNNLTTYRFTWTGDQSSWTCNYQCVGSFDYLNFGTKYFVEMQEQLVPSPIKDGRFIPIDTTTLEVDTNNNVSTKLIKGGNGIIISKEPNRVNCDNNATAINAAKAGSSSVAIGADAEGSYCINIGSINNYNLAESTSVVVGMQNSCQGKEFINVFGSFNTTSQNASYKTIIGNGAENDNGCQFRYIVGINNTVNQRKTGQAIDTDGNHYLRGDVYANCTDYTTTSTGLNTPRCGGKKLATEEYVDSRIPAPPSADGEYNLHCSIVNGVPTYTWKAEPANRDEVSY